MRPFDANGTFISAAKPGELRQTALRGATATVVGQAAVFFVQLVATVALARLLTPDDFGLVAMVTTFSLLLMGFGSMGFTDAMLQKEKLDHQLTSNLFWINSAAGLFLAILFSGAGALVARLSGHSRAGLVCAGVSLTILFGNISVQHLALLKRAMCFSAISLNEVVGRLLCVSVSISLALMGFRYWALVAGAVAQALSICVGAWILCRWTPSRPRKAASTGSVLWFAMHTYGRLAMNYAGRNLDNVLVGWRFGSDSLGFYKKAYDLFLLAANQTVAPMSEVAVSTLSRIRNDPERYRRTLLSVLSVLALVGMGFAATLTIVGKDLVLVLFGPQWGFSGDILRFFGPGAGIIFLYYTHSWICLSLGRPDKWLRWGLIELAVTVSLFLIFMRFGPIGFALAWVSSFWVLFIPALWYAGNLIDLPVRSVVGAIWRYVVAAAATYSVSVGLYQKLSMSSEVPPSLRVVLSCCAILTIYLCLVLLLYGNTSPVRQVVRLMREVISRKQYRYTQMGVGGEETEEHSLNAAPSVRGASIGNGR